MEEKLTRLYNTLLMVETKGGNTKIMAECLRFLEQMIQEEQQAAKKANEPKVVSEPA